MASIGYLLQEKQSRVRVFWRGGGHPTLISALTQWQLLLMVQDFCHILGQQAVLHLFTGSGSVCAELTERWWRMRFCCPVIVTCGSDSGILCAQGMGQNLFTIFGGRHQFLDPAKSGHILWKFFSEENVGRESSPSFCFIFFSWDLWIYSFHRFGFILCFFLPVSILHFFSWLQSKIY